MSAKTKFYIFGLFIITFFSSTLTAQKSIIPIQTWVTKSGTSVFYVNEPALPIIDIQVVFDAGSARDPASKAGIAKMTNDSLNAGTLKKNVDEIASAFDEVGALYSSAVNRDMAVVALRSLAEPNYFQPALTSFIQVLTEPSFPTAQFTRIQKQMLNSLRQQEEQPSSIAAKAFFNSVYDNNPYGHPISGTSASVSQLKAEDIRDFHKTYYTSQNALIAIVGDIDQKKAHEIAENISMHLGKGQKLNDLVFKPFTPNQYRQHVAFPSSQTHVIIGQMGIDRKDPAYFPIMIGNYILGGGGLTSRLFNEVREKRGLAYSVSSQFAALKDKGPFMIELQTRNNEANNAIQVTHKTIDDFISKGPSDIEVSSAKKNLTQGFILRLASNSAIAAQLINIGFYKLPLNYLDTFTSNINNVTDQEIKTVFQKNVHPEHLITVTVGGASNGQEVQKSVH